MPAIHHGHQPQLEWGAVEHAYVARAGNIRCAIDDDPAPSSLGKPSEALRKGGPHARLYVDVVNEQGEVENWNFELPSPTTLMRRGWTRKSLQPGDRVTVAGARAKDFPTIAYARSIRNADGEPMFTGVTEIEAPQPVSESSSGSPR